MLGLELGEVTKAVRSATGRSKGPGERSTPSPAGTRGQSSSDPQLTDAPARPFSIAELPADPSTRLERDALQAMLQYPDAVGAELLRHAIDCRFGNASLAVVRDGISSVLASPDPALRIDRVVEEVPAPFAGIVRQLAVAPVPQRSEGELTVYVRSIVGALIDRELLRQKSELLGRLQRTDRGDTATYATLQRALVELETERRALRGD
jgi:DNA primase